MNRFIFWYRWLLCVSILILLFGVLLVVDVGMNFIDTIFNPLFWIHEEIGESALKFQRFVYSVLGATMIGWGTMLYGITKNAIVKKERWARDTILWSLFVWCIVDSTASVTLGASINVLLNLFFLVAVTVPLFATYKEFRR